jgi:hypothetical protein
MGCTIDPISFRGRPAIAITNGVVELVVLTGGGHLASFKMVEQGINVLWEPHWPTIEPSMRNLGIPGEFDDSLESKLLSSILGHNLCLDVFGAQSQGESDAGLTFHGEAGMVTWEVDSAEISSSSATLTMTAFLRQSALDVSRMITLKAGESSLRIRESVRNLVGFERVYGCAEHATLGESFLKDSPALFACNADKGVTWPTGDELSTLSANTEFDYPDLPLAAGGTTDWRSYPRAYQEGNLFTMRIRPGDSSGWFTAVQNRLKLGVYYVWEREAFPWLMTWEEAYNREALPWSQGELTRGMEFSSYPFALSRRDNVAIGELLGVPAFQWLDAHETRTTEFTMGLFPTDDDVTEAPPASEFCSL